MKKLTPVIAVVEEKCINCHACIAACPIKFCNDGSGDHVKINSDTCIGCGACITACTHEARVPVDDTPRFLEDLGRQPADGGRRRARHRGKLSRPVFAVERLAEVAGRGGLFRRELWHELTIKSYLEHVAKNHPRSVIAKPCPAIVTYIEMYRPELLPYLAPRTARCCTPCS